MNDARFSDKGKSTCTLKGFFTQSWGDSLREGKLATNPNRSVSKTSGINAEKVRKRGPHCVGFVAN